VIWRCENVSCPRAIRRGLEHFASRKAMRIEGIGESVIDQLITRGLVHDYADLYYLTVEQFATLISTSTNADGKEITRKSARRMPPKVVAEIGKSKAAGLGRVLYAIGIRHVGEGGASALARAFGSMTALRSASLPQLEAVVRRRSWSAGAVRQFLDEPRNAALRGPAHRSRTGHDGADDIRADRGPDLCRHDCGSPARCPP